VRANQTALVFRLDYVKKLRFFSVKMERNMTTSKGNEKTKWSKQAILCLIEAYKEELCLYAANTPNYHKHVRNEALKNVCAAVSVFKPGITESMCAAKFHNLGNQFDTENAKVKASMKFGTSTDDVNMKI